ncbi:hypothetical protein RJ639_023689 [Escallonia herrerae]|uniref:Uncharacterized protein n=1 Tax=Escallonia herrerae TaxID=1293975 RepID=A0AA89AES9_9ASTE|nr:hypothetical protein RJ639_025133 [Escallonia herrerae]KAK3000088.1 hypothetical protein RJ639_023689 [Escallonia herrerae]
MAQAKIFLSSLLLVLVFSQVIESIEGRHLNLEKKIDIPNLLIPMKSYEKVTKPMADNNKTRPSYANEALPKAPMTPVAPMPPSQTVGESPPPPPGHADDFRPTTPGHSPGVGHSIQN